MADNPVIAAVGNRLKATALVTSLLGSGASSIVASGRVTQQVLRPAIEIIDVGEKDSARRRPFVDDRVRVRVYGNMDAANVADYTTIRHVLFEVIKCLDRAPLSTNESYQALFEFIYDGYTSGDQFSTQLQLPYVEARFCAHGARFQYDPQTS